MIKLTKDLVFENKQVFNGIKEDDHRAKVGLHKKYQVRPSNQELRKD